MKHHNLPQGSREWHAHRAQHFNASDAPAMLGCSPYQTRSQLLHALYTGLRAEVDAATQRRFDDGHRFEALARPLAEQIIGNDLYPVVGTEGRLSASFDGLTMDERTAFEHKALNDDLRGCMGPSCIGRDLPKHYRVQMEQQLLVSGADRVLFMATKWTPSGELVEQRYCWYESDPALRAEIVAGWAQFEQDLAAYQPPEKAAAAAIVAAPVQALPAVAVQVAGEIAIRHNFDAFEVALRDFLEHRLIRQPKTDQDFADLDVQIKAMKGAEAALESAEQNWIAQIEAVGSAKRTKDMLHKLVRDNRLMAEKLLGSEKERRRIEIVDGARTAYARHIETLKAETGGPWIVLPAPDFAGAIKGMRSLTAMEDAVATALANAKIAANESASTIRAALAALDEESKGYEHLFSDRLTFIGMIPEAVRLMVRDRIAKHQEGERRRAAELAERERERIRAEEAARADREAQERAAAERRQREEQEAATARQAAEAARAAQPPAAAPIVPPAASSPAANVVPMQRPATAPAAAPTLKLGDINARIAPLSIDAAGLAALGFAHSATDKAAKLYFEHQFHGICAAIAQHVVAAANRQKAAA